MVISKNATKLMAFVLTVAFVLMGLTYVPKEAQAAEVTDAPTVRVLGATLRLDNEPGTQSLRIAIEVSKASLAKACGIIITSKETNMTVIIATDVDDGTDENGRRTKRHTEMYSIDTENDKVIYSAVITGIPVDKFDKLFDVTGYVKAVDTVEEEKQEADSGEPVIKSVQGVVEALQKIDNSIDIDEETGQLVRIDEDGNSTELGSDDPVFGGDMSPTPLVINASITDKPSDELDVNSSVILGVSIEKSHDAQIKSVDWSVSGGAVIEQDADDKTKAEVTAVKAGTATVYATVTASDGQQTVTGTATAEIQIKQPYAPEKLVINPSITGITAEEKNVGEKFELGISLDKDNVEVKSVDWSVRGGAAVIEPDGADKKKAVVTAVSGGTATVYATVTVSDGEQTATGTATAEINVKEQQIQEPLEISATITGVPSGQIDINDEVKLTVSVDKKNVEIESVDWSVSGGVVIKQDAADKTKAVATAVSAGNATVYATVTVKEKDGERTATDTAKYAINVKEPPEPLIITANIAGILKEMNVNDTAELVASFTGKGKIEKVEWSISGGAAVIEKNDNDMTKAELTAVKEGTATVSATVTANYNGQKATNTATTEVKVNKQQIQDPLEIKANITAPKTMSVSGNATLSVSVDKGTIESVEWSIRGGAAVIESNEKEMTKAVVKAVQAGTATVYAKVTVKDGEQKATDTATAVITVNEPAPTPTPLTVDSNIKWGKNPIFVDLSSKDSYIIDGDRVTAQWNSDNETLDVSASQWQGIIFKNLAQDIDEYQDVTITYTPKENVGGVSAYIFDGEMGNDGKGSGSSGEQDMGKLDSNGKDITVTYKAEKSMYGLKLVSFNGTASLSIKSIVFTKPEQSYEPVNMDVNETALFNVSVDKGTIEDVEWSVRGGAAVIERDGNDKTKAVVTAVKAGTATVSAKVTVSHDGQTATDTATVDIKVLFGINAKISDAPEEMYVDDTKFISVVPDLGNDKNAKITDIEWTSLDESVIEVVRYEADKTVAAVSAKGEGTATIRATVIATSGGQETRYDAQTEITVKPSSVPLDLSGAVGDVLSWDGKVCSTVTKNDDNEGVTIDTTSQWFTVSFDIPKEYSDYTYLDVLYEKSGGGSTVECKDLYGKNIEPLSRDNTRAFFKKPSDNRIAKMTVFSNDANAKMKINAIRLVADNKILSEYRQIELGADVTTSYENGQIHLSLSDTWGGQGVKWALHEPIDLSKYKVRINYDTVKDAPVECAFYDANGELIDDSRGLNVKVDEHVLELDYSSTAAAKMFYIKYQSWNDKESVPSLGITIKSVELVLK